MALHLVNVVTDLQQHGHADTGGALTAQCGDRQEHDAPRRASLFMDWDGRHCRHEPNGDGFQAQSQLCAASAEQL
jgi:hypothetical protein